MLNLDQRKSRLEELLDRVRHNRDKVGSSVASSGVPVAKAAALPSPSEPPPVERRSWSPDSKAPIPEPEVPETAVPAVEPEIFRMPPESEPVEAVVIEPEEEPASVAASPVSEPEPVETVVIEPEEEPASLTLSPAQEAVEAVALEPEAAPGSVTVTPEPEAVSTTEPEYVDEPEIVTAAEDEALTPPESDEPITIIPSAPEPEPMYAAPPVAPPVETRTFDTRTEATAPVLSVRGERPRDWTLGAVLDRAWRLGSADPDES